MRATPRANVRRGERERAEGLQIGRNPHPPRDPSHRDRRRHPRRVDDGRGECREVRNRAAAPAQGESGARGAEVAVRVLVVHVGVGGAVEGAGEVVRRVLFGECGSSSSRAREPARQEAVWAFTGVSDCSARD